MRARVVGLGQALAGDDGVGLAVARALGGRTPPGVEVALAREPSALVDLVEGADLVVVVDAALAAGPPGRVLRLAPEDLGGGAALLSTHGVDVPAALGLARATAAGPLPRVVVVAVTIDAAVRYREALSPAVAAAVPAAVEEVLRVVAELGGGAELGEAQRAGGAA